MNAFTEADTTLTRKHTDLVRLANDRLSNEAEFTRLTDKARGVVCALDELRANGAYFGQGQAAMTATMNEIARRQAGPTTPAYLDGLTEGLRTLKAEYDVEFGH